MAAGRADADADADAAGAKRKTKTPHSDVGKNEIDLQQKTHVHPKPSAVAGLIGVLLKSL